MNSISMRGEWEEFLRVARPTPTSDKQLEQAKRLFYAGFIACFTKLNREINSMDDETALLAMEGLANEISQYIHQRLREHDARN